MADDSADAQRYDRNTRRWWIATFFVVLVALGAIGFSVLWALYGPSEPIVISSLTTAPVVQQGQPIIYTVHACKNLDAPSTIYTQIIGVGDTGFSYAYGIRHGVAHTGCHVTKVVIPPPYGLPAGTYVLKNEASYQVNPLRTVTVPSQSASFTIVPKT